MQQGSSPWELDSDEIASVTSDDLNRNRPNRWTGPKSTWRAITEEERLLWHSMKQLRDQDLGVHLYNAFALKRRGQDAALARDLTIKTVCRRAIAVKSLLTKDRLMARRLSGRRPGYGLRGR